MGKYTLLVLLLLVAVLAYLRLQRAQETASGGPALEEYALCPGLTAERVRALRVDHLARNFQLEFERDAAGRWFLTDPVAYPAQSALVRTLLASLESARGEPAPEADPAQVGLEPPQVVLEIVLAPDEPAGPERRLRLELGALDVDPSRIHARVPGHPGAAASEGDVFRTTRVLANTLERFPDDYRDRRATTLAAQDVVALRRRGQVYLAQDRLEDLQFDALQAGDGWKRVGLPTVSLDPSAIGLFVRGATELAIERFVDDSPQDLTRWGLDPPVFTLVVELASGEAAELSFGHRQAGQDLPVSEIVWYCQRKGYAHVWEVRTRDVELLTQPADMFFDQLVVRALRADVARLELEGGGTRRVLAREKKGWSVWEDARATAADVLANPGNESAIEEALAQLERVQLAQHLPAEAFEPCDPPCSFTVVLRDGLRFGGALGRPTRDPETAAEGRQFLRLGDEVVALIDARVFELCGRPLDDFRSRKVHQIQESLVRAIDLEHAGKTYTFVNTGDNQWSPKGQPIRAPDDFAQSLDGLLNLGARRWLAAASEHERVLGVRVLSTQGEETTFAFGRAGDGTTLWLGPDGQAAEVDGSTMERLLRLF